MKQKSSLIFGLLCITSFALAQGTATLGTFGFTRVAKPAGKLNLVGNNFGDSASTLNEIAPVDQFNGARFADSADQVIVWDSSSQQYVTYALYDNGTVKEWRLYSDFYGSAVNPAIPAGSGFWVDSQGSSSDTNLVVSGSVVDASSITNQLISGLQMVAYPFSTTVDLNSTTLKDQGTGARFADSADQIIAWNSALQQYVTYALYDNGTVKEWRKYSDFYSSPGAINLDLGAGFWYKANNAFTWIEANPYQGSL